MHNINENKLYETTDLGCAAAIECSRRFKPPKLDKSNPKKVLFCFQYEDGIQQAADDYFTFNFQVDAQTYFNFLRSLKTQIYNS